MKKLFYFLIPIFAFFGIQFVNASAVISADVPSNWCGSGADTCSFTYNETKSINFKNAFYGYGNGTVTFSYFQYGRGSLYEITAENSNGLLSQCSLLSTTGFIDNDQQYSIVTANCPVDFSNSGLKNIYFHNVQVTSDVILSDFQLSNRVTFVQDSKYDIISSIQSININELLTRLSNIYGRIDSGFHDIYELLQGNNDEILKKQGELLEEQKKNNQALNDLNNSLNNSDTSGSQSELENVNDKFKDDISKSPISDLVNLPLKLLTAFNNKLSSNQVCTPYDMGTLFGVHWLQLPCINPPDYLGSVLWATIDMISTALLLWAIAHKMVKVYISISTIDGHFVTKIISQTGGML